MTVTEIVTQSSTGLRARDPPDRDHTRTPSHAQHALLTMPTVSVAIDAIPEADCTVDTDQRGEPRPVAIVGPEPKCDVGAFEVQP